MKIQLFVILQLAAFTFAWLPKDKNYFNLPKSKQQISNQKVRGVNLGSLFVIEPWMAHVEWANMGCGDAKSEFDCVLKLGQTRANQVFAEHWNRWITEADLDQMKSYGLNTIRIPVGYWIKEDLVYKDSEHFPQGGLGYLDRLVGWASNRNIFIIMDLHGAPGAQVPKQPFTGQYASNAGFYVWWQYNRAIDWLKWMTHRIHTNYNYRGVGVIQVVNEPESGFPDLVTSYYPQAMAAVRDTERSLGIGGNNMLHVMFMDKRWGAGDPNAKMSGDTLWRASYDNHRYIKWDTSVALNNEAYLVASCNDDLSGNWPLIVGEWSISPADAVEHYGEFAQSNTEFFKKWFAAQVIAYEKQDGWVFWTWKTDIDDYRWNYQKAVARGVIPRNPDDVYSMGVCNGRIR